MLIELIRRVATESPQRPVIVSDSGRLTYGEALTRAEALARGLAARAIERFAIAANDPADVLTLLAASSAIGSEACVYPRDLDGDGIGELAGEFGHDVVVTDGTPSVSSAQALPVTSISADAAEPLPAADAAPVMILTTGTTGRQKGARHDWSRLAGAVRHPDERGGNRWLLVYNLNQFAGIQVLLHVLVSAATLVTPPTRQPRDAVAAMREHRVTHASATPTFWRLVVGTLDAETAAELALEQITLGGEAAPEGLIEQLGELFPGARISHVYAGTEFGSAVAVSDGRSGLPISVLERDENAPVRIRIVDGELQMRSRVGMLGYHGAGDDEDEWRPTGDLVEVRGDRIQFVGRTTEIINVGGAKVHPLPIEELVCRIEGVELAAAYGRPNPITGQIVALDVVATPGADRTELEMAIRKACAELPAAGRPRRIRFVEELAVRGQKLSRPGARVEA